MSHGWIKLHRSLLDWEWYTDQNTSRLFIHLLLRANHKDKKWRGISIQKGQLLTGRKALAKETGLSEQQVRTSLDKLKSTNEITIKSTKASSVITVVAWDSHQQDNQQDNQQVTNEQPTSNQQVTTNKNVKNDNNEKNKEAPPPKDPKKEEWTPPQGLNIEAWDLFTAHRKEINKPLKTDRTKTGQANKLKDLTPDQQMSVVNLSCDEGWVGLFPEKITTPQAKSFNQPQQEGAKFRPYVHEKTERTAPPEGMMDDWRKLL
jgi:hypothetical protein